MSEGVRGSGGGGEGKGKGEREENTCGTVCVRVGVSCCAVLCCRQDVGCVASRCAGCNRRITYWHRLCDVCLPPSPPAAGATLDADWRDDSVFATCSNDGSIAVCKMGSDKALKTWPGDPLTEVSEPLSGSAGGGDLGWSQSSTGQHGAWVVNGTAGSLSSLCGVFDGLQVDSRPWCKWLGVLLAACPDHVSVTD